MSNSDIIDLIYFSLVIGVKYEPNNCVNSLLYKMGISITRYDTLHPNNQNEIYVFRCLLWIKLYYDVMDWIILNKLKYVDFVLW